jgi:hypothetical protein
MVWNGNSLSQPEINQRNFNIFSPIHFDAASRFTAGKLNGFDVLETRHTFKVYFLGKYLKAKFG